jgi:hypothetical protein
MAARSDSRPLPLSPSIRPDNLRRCQRHWRKQRLKLGRCQGLTLYVSPFNFLSLIFCLFLSVNLGNLPTACRSLPKDLPKKFLCLATLLSSYALSLWRSLFFISFFYPKRTTPHAIFQPFRIVFPHFSYILPQF